MFCIFFFLIATSASVYSRNFWSASDEAIAPESSTQNPLVSVTFQRDPNRKQKYLEAEPKALGLRAGLGMQILSTVASFFNSSRFAISVTLAVYACKVVNCCGPAGKMPVITVQTPPPAES
ncbi:uncharacterized protein LOC133157414 [Syngnathus typhle]|uniref:uncharacterized protein LOC133157414 n=1 Tax=Syngnathus typhle TaxID=161592 RepID=UPI002A69F537|nr:uncharacterized protein LOC133157414 [Syngnathus typhle]